MFSGGSKPHENTSNDSTETTYIQEMTIGEISESTVGVQGTKNTSIDGRNTNW